MSQALGRRQFLQGNSARRPAFRPPWALPETDFLDRCTRCGECLEHCETGILEAGDGGYPEVRFARGECTFCGACASQCAPGAIRRHNESPWNLRVVLHTQFCLATQGVVCGVCAETCAPRAIRMTTHTVVPTPHTDMSACTGCGACIAPCPASALYLHALPTENIPCT